MKQGEVDALAKHGIHVTIDDCTRLFSGFSPEAGERNFREAFSRDLPQDFFKHQVEQSLQLFRDRLTALNDKTVNTLHRNGINQCVASGSPLNRVMISLEKGNMLHCFKEESIFTRELVKKGKPSPDLFLLAAERMGVKHDECLVIEDSVAGVEAAIAARMDVIGFLGGGE